MYKLIVELFELLSVEQRKKFYKIQLLVIFMAIFELIGVASIGPFMALVGDIDLVESNHYLNAIYGWFEVSKSEFLIVAGSVVLCLLFISAVLSMLTVWMLALFAAQAGTDIANRLYTYYLNRDWLFHSATNNAYLTKQISIEATRVTDLILQPLMQMNSRIVLAVALSIFVVIINPLFAVTGLVIFAMSYFTIYAYVRRKLNSNGKMISTTSEGRYRLINEAFGGVREIKLLGRESLYSRRFSELGDLYASARGRTNAYWQVPRYLMELIAFGSMIVLVIFLTHSSEGDISEALAVISIYAFAGFKLLPAFQLIYGSISQIKGNMAAYHAIREDLKNSQEIGPRQDVVRFSDLSKSDPNTCHSLGSIVVRDVNFKYPNRDHPALININMEIHANSIVGIVGPSGSGKSTMLDILLGLIKPTSGETLVNGQSLNQENIDDWKRMIGYVPQAIFLTEGTVENNIAFGLDDDAINSGRVDEVIKLCHLEDIIERLPNGKKTKIGERGIQLSGGERQRIGIARALYNDPPFLLLDEATSALDGVSEKLVMDAIQEFHGTRTIIMIAHRLKTVENCDCIYVVDKGRIVSRGSYQALLKESDYFQQLGLRNESN